MSSYSGTPDDQSVNKHIELLNAAAPTPPRAQPMRQVRSDSSETLRAIAIQSSYARQRDDVVHREPSSSSSYRPVESHATGRPRRLQHQMSMDVVAAAIADRRLPRIPTGPRFPQAATSDESDDDEAYTTRDEQSVVDDGEDYYSPSVASVEIPGVGSGRVRSLPPPVDAMPLGTTLGRSSSGLYRAASGSRLRAAVQPKQVVSSVPHSLGLDRSVSASTYDVGSVDEPFSRLHVGSHADDLDALTRLYGLGDTPASVDSSDLSVRLGAPRLRARNSRNALGRTYRHGETTDSAASTGDSLSPPELDTDSSAYSPASLEHVLTPHSVPASVSSAELPSTAGHFASWLPSPSSRSPGSAKPGERRSMVLPSVRSKVAAFESRQQALRTFASTEDLAPRNAAGLTRHDSILSEAPSAFVGAASLTRMDSVESHHFRAPLLRDPHRAGRRLR